MNFDPSGGGMAMGGGSRGKALSMRGDVDNGAAGGDGFPRRRPPHPNPAVDGLLGESDDEEEPSLPCSDHPPVCSSEPDEEAAADQFSVKVRKPYTITKPRERWTDDEHRLFVEALGLYGRKWSKIAAHIGSKTAIQIRSHAQKFFDRVEKNQSDGGVPTENIAIPPPRPKRKPLHPYPKKAPPSTGQQSATPPPVAEHYPHAPPSELDAVNAVVAAASAAATAAAAAVVASSSKQVQAKLRDSPPMGFPFFGRPITSPEEGIYLRAKEISPAKLQVSPWKQFAAGFPQPPQTMEPKAWMAAAKLHRPRRLGSAANAGRERVHPMSDGASACSYEEELDDDRHGGLIDGSRKLDASHGALLSYHSLSHPVYTDVGAVPHHEAITSDRNSRELTTGKQAAAVRHIQLGSFPSYSRLQGYQTRSAPGQGEHSNEFQAKEDCSYNNADGKMNPSKASAVKGKDGSNIGECSTRSNATRFGLSDGHTNSETQVDLVCKTAPKGSMPRPSEREATEGFIERRTALHTPGRHHPQSSDIGAGKSSGLQAVDDRSLCRIGQEGTLGKRQRSETDEDVAFSMHAGFGDPRHAWGMPGCSETDNDGPPAQRLDQRLQVAYPHLGEYHRLYLLGRPPNVPTFVPPPSLYAHAFPGLHSYSPQERSRSVFWSSAGVEALKDYKHRPPDHSMKSPPNSTNHRS